MTTIHKATLAVPAEYFENTLNILPALAEAPFLSSGLNETGEGSVLEIFTEECPVPEELDEILATFGLSFEKAKWHIEPLTYEGDWAAYGYVAPDPFTVGPFLISPPDPDLKSAPGQIVLQLNADTAFGTGDHPTTKACLEAMCDLKGRGVCPWNVLDLGTGSGILAIAAWKLWKTMITAVDIEEAAIARTQENAKTNRVPLGNTGLLCTLGDGARAQLVKKRALYELIVANILCGPLVEMAADLCAVLDRNGYILLSGMLETQAEQVLNTYQAQGLTLKTRMNKDGWVTLLLRKA